MNLLVSDPTNIRYLTGFVSAEPHAREAYVLVTPKKTYLFTNSLYTEQAKSLGLTVIEISRDKPLSRAILPLTRGKLYFEEANLTVAEYNQFKNITLIPTRNKIENLRLIKKASEIASIRQAAALTDRCFTHIKTRIKPGVSEAELAWEIESFIRKNDATLAFTPIVAFNNHSSQPHYQMSDGRLRTSDLVLVDFGARVNGYCSDMTRVIFIGKPKNEWKRAYAAVLEAQKRALDALSSGERSGAKLDRLAKTTIEKAGFTPYSHSLGHAVGLAIHEAPRLTVKKDETLKPGMVFSIEPAIYVEGSFGIRIEDLVLLKKDGAEILSKSPKDLTIIN